MKTIELTIQDDVCGQVLAVLAGFPLISLTVETVDLANEELAQVIDYIARLGENLQANGRRNSTTTAADMIDGLKAGEHRIAAPQTGDAPPPISS